MFQQHEFLDRVLLLAKWYGKQAVSYMVKPVSIMQHLSWIMRTSIYF